MDPDFENLLKETEKRRKQAMKEFYDKYENDAGDSDDEVIDWKTLQVIKPGSFKGKKKKNLSKSLKKRKRVPIKAIKFGEMNSYCISIESRKYVKKITRRINAIKPSNDDTLLSYEIEEHEVEETTKILVKKDRIDAAYDLEKSDLSEDDDKSICNESQNENFRKTDATDKHQIIDLSKEDLSICNESQNGNLSKTDATYNHEKIDLSNDDKSICLESLNETLPLNCKSNLNFSLADPYDLNNTKLDSLTCGQVSVGKKFKGIFPKIHKLFAYSQYFRSSPTLDVLRKKLNICSLAGEDVEYQNYSRKKYVDSICKFSNTFSRPKSVKEEALKPQKCFVKLQRLPENYSFQVESCYDFKSFQNVLQLKCIENSMSVNQDNSIQKLPEEESSLKKTLQETNTPVAMRKGLRPRCPNSGLVVLKDCSCNECVAQKLSPAICIRERKSKEISNPVVNELKKCNFLPEKNIFLSKKSEDEYFNSSHRISKYVSTQDSNNKVSLNLNNPKITLNPVSSLSQCSSSSDVPIKKILCDKMSAHKPKNIAGSNKDKFQSFPCSSVSEESNASPNSKVYTSHIIKKSPPRKVLHSDLATFQEMTKYLSMKKSNNKISSKINNPEDSLDLANSPSQYLKSSDVTIKNTFGDETPALVYKDVRGKDKSQNIFNSAEAESSSANPSKKNYSSYIVKKPPPRKIFHSNQETSKLNEWDNDPEDSCHDINSFHRTSKYPSIEKSNKIPPKINKSQVILNPCSLLIQCSSSSDLNTNNVSCDETSACIHEDVASTNKDKLQNTCSILDQGSNALPRNKINTSHIIKKSPTKIVQSHPSTFQETSESIVSNKSNSLSKKNVAVSEESNAGNFDYDYIYSVPGISFNEISAVKSNDKIFSPKISCSVDTFHSLKSEKHYSNLKTANDYSNKVYSVHGIENGISCGKFENKTSSSNEPDMNDTTQSKNSSSQSRKKHPVSEASHSSIKTIYTSHIVEKSPQKKIFHSYPATIQETFKPTELNKSNSLPKKSLSVLEESDVEKFDHSYIDPIRKTSRSEFSEKLSSVKSSDKDNSPKINLSKASSCYHRSKEYHSHSRHVHVKDSSGGDGISYRKNKHKISSSNEPPIKDIIRIEDTSTQAGNKHPMVKESNISPSKKLHTSYIVKKSLPTKIFSSRPSSKVTSFLPKKNVSESEESGVENLDHDDIDYIQMTSHNQVSKTFSTEKSNDKDYSAKVRTSVTSSYSLKSEEHSSNSRQSDDEDSDHGEINYIHKTSPNKISKKLSIEKSGKEDYCPKNFRISVASSYSLRSKRHPHSQHAKIKDCSGGSCPVPKSKNRISYSKDKFNISRSTELAINKNRSNKGNFTPQTEKTHPLPSETSVPNMCQTSLLGNNSSNKDISSSEIVKKNPIFKKMYTPNTYSTKNIDTLTSCSVTKSDLKKLNKSWCLNKRSYMLNHSFNKHLIHKNKQLFKKLKNTPNISVDSISML